MPWSANDTAERLSLEGAAHSAEPPVFNEPLSDREHSSRRRAVGRRLQIAWPPSSADAISVCECVCAAAARGAKAVGVGGEYRSEGVLFHTLLAAIHISQSQRGVTTTARRAKNRTPPGNYTVWILQRHLTVAQHLINAMMIGRNNYWIPCFYVYSQPHSTSLSHYSFSCHVSGEFLCVEVGEQTWSSQVITDPSDVCISVCYVCMMALY